MDKQKIISNFETDITKPKKQQAMMMKLILLFCLLIVFSVLLFAFSLVKKSYNNVQVVDKSGAYLKVNTISKEKLFRSLLESHCANSVGFANSFDRLTILENQARAKFLINATDAARIFSKYKTENAYSDALDRGIVYRTNFQKIDFFNGDREPYHVVFTSILQIYDNGNIAASYTINSEGEIIHSTPQYPENTSGFMFTKYAQTYTKMIGNAQK
jgi:hypothetical protein